MKELQILDDVKMVWDGGRYVHLMLMCSSSAANRDVKDMIYLTPEEIINMARIVEQWLKEEAE